MRWSVSQVEQLTVAPPNDASDDALFAEMVSIGNAYYHGK